MTHRAKGGEPAQSAVRQRTFREASISPEVINELVDGSKRLIDDMLWELHNLIESEVDPKRKESLVKIKLNAMKERTNFRVLSRHIATAAAAAAATSFPSSSSTASTAKKSVLDPSGDDFAEGMTGDFKKDFENLPEKLVEKFARDLPVIIL